MFVIDDCVLSDANDNDDVKALKAMVYSTCSKRSIRLAASKDATKKKGRRGVHQRKIVYSLFLYLHRYSFIQP